jgi:hypothetical protein
MPPKKKPTQAPAHTVGKQELLLHLKAPARLPDGTEVVPGANQVSAKTLEMVRTNPLMRKWLAKGLLSIREHVPEPGSVQYDLSMGLPLSLLGLSLETIREAVQICKSRDQIRNWLNDAGNPEVRELLINRSYQIAVDEASTQAEAAN